MDDASLEALIAAKKQQAKKAKKKKKKPPPTDVEMTGGGGGGGGDVVKKKKKRKKREGTREGVDVDGDLTPARPGGRTASSLLEDRARSKNAPSVAPPQESRKSSVAPSPARDRRGTHTSSLRGSSSTSFRRSNSTSGSGEYGKKASVNHDKDEEDAERRGGSRRRNGGNDDDGEGGRRGNVRQSGTMTAAEVEGRQSVKPEDVEFDHGNGNGNGGGGGGGGGAGGYYAGAALEADAYVMAEINQEGLVHIDESGGIQAFVAETIAIDDDAVGIIKSDAEVEREEKKKYTKYFCGAVTALVVVIVAVAAPLTMKFARGDEVRIQKLITESPTDIPSMIPSIMPSSMPSSIRFMEIVTKLEPISGTALRVQGTSQYKAAMWMADRDPIPNKAGGTGLNLDDPAFEQRYIMALFYYAMDGDGWENRGNWLGPDKECFWFGIDGEGVDAVCGGQDSGGCIKRGDLVGDYDKVCRIDLSEYLGVVKQGAVDCCINNCYNSLYGQIPSELGLLTEMRWLGIQESYLTGTIPESLGQWTNLLTFLVGGNYLEGGFPESFEYNEMLGTIFIDRNNLNGTFPSVFTTLSNLEWLDAANNRFTGTIPEEIGNLKSLRQINVNNNSLTGYLPTSWDENNLIENFEAEDNGLKGPLPETFGNCRWLKDLHLSRNELTGEIPTSFYDLENLEELYLDENNFVGELPQTPEVFYDGLQELSIHSNKFSGRFPVENFEDTLRVKVLMLHSNELTGTITSNICDRMDASLAWSQLTNLTADCDKIECSCCTCYIDGEFVDGDGN
ncbi:hypothetical protein ACHAXA_006485 [Cyclostephanos tholiformis]|uniref:L domain-like protein n=1 Tax=Cyclostephanos tholiformis TaxID=382380 RepID=A0ABD3RZF9_9STRA